MINNYNNLSAWLPPSDDSPSTSELKDLKDLDNASSWLEVGSGNPVIENLSISPKIGTSLNFHETIFRVFGGEPKRVAPQIQSQKNGQSMLDFLGRGFEFRGPANHSQPLTFRHQKPSVNQKSLLDFVTNNPFASPSSTIASPRVNQQTRIIYC